MGNLRWVFIDENDIAALGAVRGVVADAVAHPARASAVAAIDRIVNTPAGPRGVNITMTGGGGGTAIGTWSDPGGGSITATGGGGGGVIAEHYRCDMPQSIQLGAIAIGAVCDLYGFDLFEVHYEMAERGCRLRVGRRGKVKSALVSDLDMECSPRPSAPWFEAIRRVAGDLGVDDLIAKDQQLVKILVDAEGVSPGPRFEIGPFRAS